LKILIYVPVAVLPSGDAGAIRIRELAENFAKLGNQVTILCQVRSSTYGGIATIKRLKPVGAKVIGFIFSTIQGLFSGIATLFREKYDLVYATAALNGANAYLVASFARLPCIIEVNGLMRDEIRVGWVGWWRKAAGYTMSWFEEMSFRRCHHLIAVTPEIKKALIADLGLNPAKIVAIPNGANIDLFKPVDCDQARKQLGLDQVTHLVAFVGRFSAWEGVHYLIKSIPYVLQEYPGTKFLIVGDGRMNEELVKLSEQINVSDNTIFTGRVPYDRVPLYINASDLCVAPLIKAMNEKAGVSPMKIFEYAACEKAIVASRLPGLEFIARDNLGILVEPDSPEELADAIMKLLREPELRRQMGKNGRKHVVENHSWESVARKVGEVCEQVIGEHKGEQRKTKL
jgi:glycosyltransferase involved in cell wall biosynthesis